jgi:hypothetical protein
MPTINVDYELIYEFDGGAVYWVSWGIGEKKSGKMVTIYESDIKDDDS